MLLCAVLFACGSAKAGPGADAAGPGPDDARGPADGGTTTDLAQPLAGCQGLPLCDDFESTTPGGPPDPKNWTLATPNCSGTGTLSIDDTVAHSGTRSVKVVGQAGYCNHIFMANSVMATLGKVAYGRFFVRLQDTLGQDHSTFMAMKDTADNNNDIRMGGQSDILMWNRQSDDATLPVLSPAGIAQSVQPAAAAWHCVEFMIDGQNGYLLTWMDGAQVPGLCEQGVSTQDVTQQWLQRGAWRPSPVDLRLGWESYGGEAMTLWIDDVALSTTRIGCQ